MVTIGSVEEIEFLDKKLAKFIAHCCPWIGEGWDPTRIGWIFVLGDIDVKAARSLCIVPHAYGSDSRVYRSSMTFDLTTFDLWEEPVLRDKATGFWNAVAILGQEFGFTVFMSPGLVDSLPELRATLEGLLPSH